MLSQESGRIIYIASQLGLKGAPDLVHYSASKAALIGMTRALAREVAPHVTVNAIAPGPIETDMLANITEEWKAMKLAGVASGAIRAGERRRADRRLSRVGRRRLLHGSGARPERRRCDAIAALKVVDGAVTRSD